jgi:hypothetical protein
VKTDGGLGQKMGRLGCVGQWPLGRHRGKYKEMGLGR